MGLDLVEFVIAVEESFGLEIPDTEAQQLETPGQLADYLQRRLQPAASTCCLNQRAFHRLRRAAMQVLGRPRGEVRPEAAWEVWMPLRGRRRSWRRLRRATGLTVWPRLGLLGGVPARWATVGKTTCYLAVHGAAELLGDHGWSRRMIETTVARLMQAQLGIRGFEWDDRFVRDLGVD